MPDLSVRVGSITLNNPVIIGSGDHTMTVGALEAARATGAGAVVAKSINESEAAKRQLDGSDHVLLDSLWRPIPWDFDHTKKIGEVVCNIYDDFNNGIEPELAAKKIAFT
jgi:hypothetical protein